MKFYKGQEVVCIANLSEWDCVVPNFDEQLKIALGVKKMPTNGGKYIVDEPLSLNYKRKTYISLVGFPSNIFDENAFRDIPKNKSKKVDYEKVKKAMLLINN